MTETPRGPTDTILSSESLKIYQSLVPAFISPVSNQTPISKSMLDDQMEKMMTEHATYSRICGEKSLYTISLCVASNSQAPKAGTIEEKVLVQAIAYWTLAQLKSGNVPASLNIMEKTNRCYNCYTSVSHWQGRLTFWPPSKILVMQFQEDKIERTKHDESSDSSDNEPNKKSSDDNECAICMNADQNCVFDPCGHFCCCFECAEQLKECPICRRSITKSIKMYKA